MENIIMNTKFSVFFSFVILGFASCEKSQNNQDAESIIDTKWKLQKVIEQSGKTIDLPSEIDCFEIVFGKNGKIDLPDYCNYSYGEYNITANGSITIFNVGAGTEKYCLPELAMDWETLFINNLITSKSYTIIDNELTVNCQDSQLVFSYEGSHSDKGKVLFHTNAHRMNCVFKIEISIADEKVGTIDAGSSYSDNDCYCENPEGIGILIYLDKGNYEFSAKEVECDATNIISSWIGNITIVGDSCTVVFLDINKD